MTMNNHPTCKLFTDEERYTQLSGFDAAFCLQPKDVAYMERLVLLQNRHTAVALNKAS